jgi:hypothetical protein
LSVSILRRAMMWLGAVFLATVVVVGFLLWPMTGSDPADRFEVLSVVSEPSIKRHAVTYRYHHANSSSIVTAVWLLTGKAPAVGSHDSAPGTPVLVWLGEAAQLGIVWQDGAFRAVTKSHVPRGGSLNDCYFAGESTSEMLCLNGIDVIGG